MPQHLARSARGHPEIRLRATANRIMVGEMGCYRDMIRTASVVADRRTVLYALDRARYATLQRDDPEACMRFQQLVVRVLSNRLEFANREISALQR